MKRHILIMWAFLLPLLALAQSSGYDPENPPQPNWPEDESTYFQLTVEAIPNGAGQFGGDANRKVKPGKTAYIYAYDHDGCYFHEWKDAQGNTLSTDHDYSFTMPSQDVKIYAVYSYSPDSPLNPETIMKYMLSLRCDPEVAGSFNQKDQKVDEGSVQYLYAYTNSGFKLINWTDESGNVVGTEQSLNFLMPSHNTTLTAHYEYVPATPQEPGTNLWDASSGELIMDFFTPGYLTDAMFNMVGGSDKCDQVTSLTVDGKVTSNDWGFAYYFKKLNYIDLSRVEGVTEVPSSRWKDNTDLQEIELPKDITKIGNYAFQGCTALMRFDCYAAVPPTLGNDVFKDVPAEMVVFVPETSVDLYKNAEGWKNFDIVPLLSKICTLEVSLPDDYSDLRYKNLLLEVINVKSGQKYRYVITDRQTYTFPTLIRKTSYKAYVKNQRDQVAGETDVIEIDADVVKVSFASVLVPKTLAVTVTDAADADVTSQVTVAWADADGNYIATGNTLEAQLPGQVVVYTLSLPEALGRLYVEPEPVNYTVAESNDINVKLTALPTMKKAGVWKAYIKGSDQMLSSATFSISQLLNGKYTTVQTRTVKASEDVELTLYNAPTTITVTANEYITETYTIDNPETDFPTKFELKPATGPVINVSFVYQPTVAEGETPQVQNYYQDYANVSYTLYNKTQDAAITSFTAQYPKISLPEDVNEGDIIRITAKSTAGTFADVTVEGKVEANSVSVVIPIVDNGGIKARFLVTDNTAVEGLLFDSKGTLLKHALYGNFNPQALEGTDANDLTFSNLEDGTYTLITIGKSEFFGSIFDLSRFDDAGLQEGVDYVKNIVNVEKGVMKSVRNVVVPVFDESKFYYTGVNTSFTVNKANVIQGNYLTMNARLDFNDEVKANVKEVELVIPLPINSDFVEGSLMIGKSIAGEYQYQYVDTRQQAPDPDANGAGYIYTSGEHSLTIQMGDNYSERVKFCIVPLKRGNFTPTAYVRFKLGGKTIVQPIGSATFTVNDVTIWTPSLVSEPYVHIDGNAPGFSEVTIWSDYGPIGYTEALADGYWSAECMLIGTTNLSMHQIYATIETKEGYQLVSERRFVEYNISSIQAKEVEMSFFNNSLNRTVVVNFDLEHSKASQPSYSFQGNTEFVFTANLTNNSPELVDSCVVRVFTNNHEWIEVPAKYIPNRDRWVAHSKFDNQTMPIGVRVYVESDISDEVDLDKVFEYYTQPIVNGRENNLNRAAATDLNIELEPVGDNSLGTSSQFFQGPLSAFDVTTFNADTLELPTVDDKMIKVYVAQDGSFIVVNPDDEGNAWGVKANEAGGAHAMAPRKVRIATDLNNELKQRIMVLSDLGQMITPYTNRNHLEALWASYKVKVQDWISNPPTTPAGLLQQKYDTRMMEIMEYAVLNVDEITQISRNINDLLSYVRYGLEDVNEWQAFADRILPCNGLDDPQARALNWLSQRNMVKHGWQYISSVEMAISSAQLLLNHLNPSLTYYLISTASASDLKTLYTYANMVSDFVMTFSTNVFLQNKAASHNHMRKAKRDKNRLINCGYTIAETVEKKLDLSLPYPIVEPIVDPSGFVYEGVSSNRLEGVTATAYYKRTYEDMYGDLQQEIVKWDAENYGQENPLYTDDQGMYAWDVPQGLWQVKFEKEGYQTTYSEWLPVPPPQLEVNIGMTQLAQPEVVKARAFEAGTNTNGGIEITFSKYMKPEMLTAENIFVKGVKDNEETLLSDLQFTCPDQEAAIEGSDKTYAKKVFVATDVLSQYDEVLLIVSSSVESYANIQMTETYQQKIDIEKKIASINVDEQMLVGYEESAMLQLAVLPTEAAAGKQIRVTTAAKQIATLGDNAEESVVLILDADGQASIKVNGALFGTTALNIEVVGEEVKAQTMVNVVDPAQLEPAKAPTASRISGTAVYRGQTVALACETEGATIYYTTDGSCPCDSETRQVYQSPIAINQAMTLKAMSISLNGNESEVVTWNYLIRQTNLALNLEEGWNWASHDLATPMAKSDLEAIATEVRTADAVATTIAAEEAVKLQVAGTIVQQLSGDQYNPTAKSIQLNAGWNWLGYPVDQELTLADALMHLQPEEGDVITNLTNGFAEYVDGVWQGSLLTMMPGQGYLYKSVGKKAFIYNAVPTTNARALRAQQSRRANATWTVNPHLYPSMMAVTAQLMAANTVLDGTTFTVAAFVGDECRGVAKATNGLFYLPVYGDSQTDAITIKVRDASGHELETTQDYTFNFQADVLGSAKAPYAVGVKLRGDVNADGVVNIADVTTIINIMAGYSTIDGDVNGDGVVNIADVTAVINIMAGY